MTENGLAKLDQATRMLADGEREVLTRCEAVIEQGLKSFIEVGTALLAIRDNRLYRAEYGTFEDYCRDRWGMVRRQADRLIAAAGVVSHLGPIGPKVPESESQARPLARLEPEEQRVVWQQVVETAPGGKVTGAHVQRLVNTHKNENGPHVAQNSGNNEWYTPPEYIFAARTVMGGIDLDPASSEKANEIVGADRFFTTADDGLMFDWWGRVWMNPPYSQPQISEFCRKFIQEYTAENITMGIVLVNNATETAWFQELLSVASAACFVRGRIKFLDPSGYPAGAPLQGQAAVYFGPNIEAFHAEFSYLGKVLYV